MPPPHHTSVGVPPPPDYWGRVHSGDRQHEFSTSRIESWGAGSYGYPPPPPPPPPGHAMHQRSGSWTHGPPPPPGRHLHQRSESWGSGREHSLGMFPLIGASVAGVADRSTFDSGRSSSGIWGDYGGSPARGTIPPPPPPPGYGGPPIRSNGSLGPYRQAISPANSTSSPQSPSPYNVDLTIAKSWSGGEVQGSWSGEQHLPPPHNYDGPPRTGHGPMHGPSLEKVPRPQMVKRDTSNQNEMGHTVKRAALNRDNSLASNRLKQEYMPHYYNQKFDEEQEMRSLSSNLEQSTLDMERPKPKPLDSNGRVSTMDVIAMDLMAKPAPFMKGDRVSTIDALDLDLDIEGDGLIPAQQQQPAEVSNLPKPKSLEPDDRLSTKDFMDLVNSPLAQVDPNSPKTEGDEPLPLDQGNSINVWG